MAEYEEKKEQVRAGLLQAGASAESALVKLGEVPPTMNETAAYLARLKANAAGLMEQAKQVVEKAVGKITLNHLKASGSLERGINGIASVPSSVPGQRLTAYAQEYDRALGDQASRLGELLVVVDIDSSTSHMETSLDAMRGRVDAHIIMTDLNRQTGQALADEAKQAAEKWLPKPPTS